MNYPAAANNEITEILAEWSSGNREALDRLIPLVQSELHRLASRYLRGERPGHTLQTTDLVNEAYMRLVDTSRVQWNGRAHFFAVSATLMRRILVDFARSKKYQKRGGRLQRVSLTNAEDLACGRDPDFIALDEALDALAVFDERKAKVVEMRFFGGLSVEETARVLDVSQETVLRDWRLAKVWLLKELTELENES